MLDLADVGPGDRVLDIAAGAGGQSLAAARRVGPTGRVLATDIAPTILDHAAADARAAGLANVETRAMDGEELDAVEEGSFDAAISRVGLIYFPDQHAALAGIRRALRPGRQRRRDRLLDARAQRLLLDPGRDHPPPRRAAAAAAGPAGAVQPRARRASWRPSWRRPGSATCASRPSRRRCAWPRAAECVRFERESFGALHQMLAGLDAGRARGGLGRDREELPAFEGPGGFEGPCEMLVAVGVR